jgi:hypothetical protein
MRRACALLLALALLAGWRAALLHPLEHSDRDGALVHLAGHERPGQDEQGDGAQPLCDVLAALASCVGNHSCPPERARPAAPRLAASLDPLAPGAPTLAYRSQAPPRSS